MTGITDIHNHILYQVDDGSDTIETSIKLLQKEYEQGVRNVILTPHFHEGECESDVKKSKRHFEQLKKETGSRFPEMQLYLGNEVMACNDIVQLLNEEKIFTLAGSNYVLVEFYPTVRYAVLERHVSKILNGGYTPIIAHCERYDCLRSRLKVIHEKNIRHLISMGAYMQVNASSVFGRDRRFVSKLIENDFLHLVASDAHSLKYRGVFWEECIKYLEKKYNNEYIEWLLVKNPAKILNGEYI